MCICHQRHIPVSLSVCRIYSWHSDKARVCSLSPHMEANKPKNLAKHFCPPSLTFLPPLLLTLNERHSSLFESRRKRQSWQLVNASGLAVQGLRAHMVDQDKSHLHGRHVPENPLAPSASSSPHSPTLVSHSQVTYSTEKKGKKVEDENME